MLSEVNFQDKKKRMALFALAVLLLGVIITIMILVLNSLPQKPIELGVKPTPSPTIQKGGDGLISDIFFVSDYSLQTGNFYFLKEPTTEFYWGDSISLFVNVSGYSSNIWGEYQYIHLDGNLTIYDSTGKMVEDISQPNSYQFREQVPIYYDLKYVPFVTKINMGNRFIKGYGIKGKYRADCTICDVLSGNCQTKSIYFDMIG